MAKVSATDGIMSFIYLATPYTKFKGGLEEANRLASKYAGTLLEAKLPVFSPIAHSHSIAVHANLAGKDHSIWMPLDFAFTEAAFALVVCKMQGWDESYGLGLEIDFFLKNKKPIYYWQPPMLNELLRRDLERETNKWREKHPKVKHIPLKV
jgi:hypothetical protein